MGSETLDAMRRASKKHPAVIVGQIALRAQEGMLLTGGCGAIGCIETHEPPLMGYDTFRRIAELAEELREALKEQKHVGA